MDKIIRKYGWRPSPPDKRDYPALGLGTNVAPFLPTKMEVGGIYMPPIWDQGNLGACSLFSSCRALEFVRRKEGRAPMTPSFLFGYYNGRADAGTINSDSGLSMHEAMKSLAHYGVCTEEEWPYDIEKFETKPPDPAYQQAVKAEAVLRHPVEQSLNGLKSTICSGLPFVIGMSVYSSFESTDVAKTGIVPFPNFSREKLLGGHGVCVCGYDDEIEKAKVANSWGEDWGDEGFFWLPYKYLFDKALTSEWLAILKTN